MVYTHILDLSAAVQSPDSRTKPAGGARIDSAGQKQTFSEDFSVNLRTLCE